MHTTVERPRRRLLTALVMATLALALIALPRADAADPGVAVAYIARAGNFPDALAGGVIAATNNAPLLLVAGPQEGDVIPDPVKAELTRLAPQNIVIFGGEAAVSAKVAIELEDYTTGTVTRLQGPDRYQTAIEISKALPGKVADADLLDGMDSSDFLGAGDKAADAELLDGKDSTDFAQPPMRMRHGPTEFLQGDGPFLGFDYEGQTVFSASGAGTLELLAPITAPLDAQPSDGNFISEEYLFGKLSSLSVCYRNLSGADRTGRVQVVDAFTLATLVSENVTWSQTTDTLCQAVTLPTNDTLETSNPLTLRVEFNATANAQIFSLHGFLTTWEPYTWVLNLGP